MLKKNKSLLWIKQKSKLAKTNSVEKTKNPVACGILELVGLILLMSLQIDYL